MVIDHSEYTVTTTGEPPQLLARVEELPGCIAVGRTPAELEHAIKQAILIYLQKNRK